MDETATEAMTTHPTCMIVEDQMLIGLALEAYLEENGFDIAGPFPSKEKALRWLQTEAPDLALLDIMLADGHCLDLARELKRRGIPFVLYSALPATAEMPSEFRGVPWLEKPINRQAVLRALESLLSPVS